ncbi:hypothetical protein ACIPMU_39105 [Streptomyces cyaneofuscatus]|uniref:hypothetical protein n=1 Tax=Streptomyces cyaneofuscatus TaxID=66883 RepID=UPI0038002648
MFHSRITRSMVLGTAGIGAVMAVSAGVAVAVADNVQAPYAQAGATVTGGGAVQNAKGVEEVRRLGAGEYCVTFTDPQFDPAKVLPSVSSLQRGMIVNYTWSSGCDKSNHSAKVSATDSSGQAADSWFSIVIH